MALEMDDLGLNLYNFENEEFAESRYVLTSPRSLQACDMLGIKPAELLYKPLSSFQDELQSTGLSLRTIYDRYDEHEKTRQKRLRECRDYRDKIIRDSMYSRMSPVASSYDYITGHPLHSTTSLLDDAGYRSDESSTSQTHLIAKQPLPSSAFTSNAVERRDIASLQRQRTAALLGSHIVPRSASPVAQRPYSVAGIASRPYTESVPVRARPRSTTPSRSVSFTTEKSSSKRPGYGRLTMEGLYEEQPMKRQNRNRLRSAWSTPSTTS